MLRDAEDMILAILVTEYKSPKIKLLDNLET